MSLIAEVAGSFAPVWPYIVGGVAAIVTALAGGWRLIVTWRSGIEADAEKKTLNTQALAANTDAAERNSKAIFELTKRLDRWEAAMQRTGDRLDDHDTRLGVLEKKPPRPRRGGSAGGREPP